MSFTPAVSATPASVTELAIAADVIFGTDAANDPYVVVDALLTGNPAVDAMVPTTISVITHLIGLVSTPESDADRQSTVDRLVEMALIDGWAATEREVERTKVLVWALVATDEPQRTGFLGSPDQAVGDITLLVQFTLALSAMLTLATDPGCEPGHAIRSLQLA